MMTTIQITIDANIIITAMPSANSFFEDFPLPLNQLQNATQEQQVIIKSKVMETTNTAV